MKNIFNNSKYSKWYFRLIEKARARTSLTAGEHHHVVPRCLGGTEVVFLSHREHFIAHLLLTKMLDDTEAKQKMYLALFCLCNGFDKTNLRQSKNRWFEISRIHASAAKSKILKGRVFSEETKLKMSISQKRAYLAGRSALLQVHAKPFSEEHKNNIRLGKLGQPAAWLKSDNAAEIKTKIALALSGKTFSEAHRKNLSKSLSGKSPPNKGRPMSEAQRKKLQKPKTQEHRNAMKKPKMRASCLICRANVSVGALKRFHQHN